MDLSLINRKAFKDKYYDAIYNGMFTAFSNLYPNNKVIIRYGCEQEWYRFTVYINGETFQKSDFPMVKDTEIFVDGFSNEQSIPLFSDIPKEEYIKQYLDYSDDNYKMVQDEWKKLKDEYEPQGVVFTDMTLTKGHYRVSFYHPTLSGDLKPNYRYRSWDKNCTEPEYIPNEWFNGKYFNVQPISTGTAKSIISSTRGALKRLMKGDFIKGKK